MQLHRQIGRAHAPSVPAVARRRSRCFCSSQQPPPLQQQKIRAVALELEPCSGPGSALALNSSCTGTSSRRSALTAAALLGTLAALDPLHAAPAAAAQEEEITARIYFDVGIASSAFKPAGERTLGDRTVLPKDAEPAGRIVLGLYGKVAPVTVSNLVAAVSAGAFNGSAFSRISPGEYVQLGKQGNRRLGDVEPPASGLQANTDVASPRPFALTHNRPGTVALSLSENDEDPAIKERPNYRALEFYITTGPGPVPRLDGLNPVFGRVEAGMDTVIRLTKVPSFQPDIRSQQLNRFAAFIGDERADNVRRQYGKPLKAIVILDSGIMTNDGTAQSAAAAAAAAASAGPTSAFAGGGEAYGNSAVAAAAAAAAAQQQAGRQ